MDDPIKSDILDLLPELYGPKDRQIKPGGMCTPESGCAPTAEHPQTDIMKILTGGEPAVVPESDDAGNDSIPDANPFDPNRGNKTRT